MTKKEKELDFRAAEHTILMNEIKKHLNSLNRDNYLSFEDVGSVRLTDAESKEYDYRWIDGIQLVRRGNDFDLVLWVSTDNSERIHTASTYDIPFERYDDLVDTIDKAVK